MRSIEPIPYKISAGFSRAINYSHIGSMIHIEPTYPYSSQGTRMRSIEPIPYKISAGLCPSNKLLSYRLNPNSVSSALHNVKNACLNVARRRNCHRQTLEWLVACELARIRQQAHGWQSVALRLLVTAQNKKRMTFRSSFLLAVRRGL